MHPDRRSNRPRALTKDYILKDYLPIFYTALLKKVDYIIHLDPFAGPGRYEDNSEGSPLHALNIINDLEYKGIPRNFRKRIIFVFAENEENTYKRLKNATDAYREQGFEVQCVFSEAKNVIKEVVSIVKKISGSLKVGMFVYLDPWGLKDVSIEPTLEVLKLRYEFNIPCEILLRFPPYLVCRFYKNPNLGPEWIERMLGLREEELDKIINEDTEDTNEKWEEVLKQYMYKIRSIYEEKTGEELSHCAVETVGKGCFYYMVFFSSNDAGISHMSNCMVKAFLKRQKEENKGSLWFFSIRENKWYSDMCRNDYFIKRFPQYLRVTPEEIEEYKGETTRERLLFRLLQKRFFAISHYSLEEALKRMGVKLEKGKGLYCRLAWQ